MSAEVSRNDVIAFRLNAHGLIRPSDDAGLLEAAGRCGVQNSPPGSALLALHARVRVVTREDVDRAVAEEKSLLQTWSMRGAPSVVPTADAWVFTAGVQPTTEAALRHLLPGVVQLVDRLGMSVCEAVDVTGAEIDDVLSGEHLAISRLGAALARRIAPKLSTRQREIWDEEGPYPSGLPIGEAVVHFCIRVLALQGTVCFAPRAGNGAPFVLVRDWLGHSIPDVDPQLARAELLRRYLRCYGPSTRADFAAWLGVRVGDTDPWWSPLDDELTPVEFGGTAWMLTEDLDALREAPKPEGVRLLPPHDPYTALRDRATIVDATYHRVVWQATGDPGTILVNGTIAGTWRPRLRGRKLTIAVRTFDALTARDQLALQAEAEQVASLRGASSLAVAFDRH